MPNRKSGAFLHQVMASKAVEVSESLVNFVTNSDRGIVHFDLQKHENLAVKKASCIVLNICFLLYFFTASFKLGVKNLMVELFRRNIFIDGVPEKVAQFFNIFDPSSLHTC